MWTEEWYTSVAAQGMIARFGMNELGTSRYIATGCLVLLGVVKGADCSPWPIVAWSEGVAT